MSAALNNDEAAALIGITPATLKFWRCKGRGPRFIKYGPSPRAGIAYDPADIQKWLDERKFASTSAYSPAAVSNLLSNKRRSSGASE